MFGILRDIKNAPKSSQWRFYLRPLCKYWIWEVLDIPESNFSYRPTGSTLKESQ